MGALGCVLALRPAVAQLDRLADQRAGPPRSAAGGRQAAHPVLRGTSRRLRAAGRRAWRLLWAAQGHHVKFVSVTKRRHRPLAGGGRGRWHAGAAGRSGAGRAAARDNHRDPGDIHDGEVLPTLENRRTITRLIREWKADIVMSHRPNDYHPDHRYTGVLVQDSAYMVAVPFFCPDVPPLKSNPVFLFYPDSFQKPNPFRPDVAVSIDSVVENKLNALEALESQFYEGGALGSAELIPTDPKKQAERRREVRSGFAGRSQAVAERYREQLAEWYGKDKAEQVHHAEAFEICEYGRRPDKKELARLFPFLPRINKGKQESRKAGRKKTKKNLDPTKYAVGGGSVSFLFLPDFLLSLLFLTFGGDDPQVYVVFVAIVGGEGFGARRFPVAHEEAVRHDAAAGLECPSAGWAADEG